MKIVLISNLYPPDARGGAENIAAMQALGLRQQGHQVAVITTHAQKQDLCQEENGLVIYRFLPVNLFYYGDLSKHRLWLRLVWRVVDIFNVFSYFKIKKILKKEKPDLVISHNLVGITYLIPVLLKNLKIKHIHFLHDVQLVEPSGVIIGNFKDNFFKKCYRQVTRLLFSKAASVVSPSKFLLDFYAKYFFFTNSQKTILPNPSPDGVSAIFKKSDSKKSHIRYFYVGQLEIHKGVNLLINVFKKLANANLSLTVIGAGSLEETVRRLGQEDSRVKILGKKTRPEVLSLLEKADYLIVPSLCYENSPTVIYESFSLGVPVIASNSGGIPELVNDKTGFLFKAGDETSLLSVLEASCTESEADYLAKQRACRAFVKNLTLDDYVAQLEEVIKKLRKDLNL